MSQYIDLAGTWNACLSDGTTHPMALPGTLDESMIGHRDSAEGAFHPEENYGNDKLKAIDGQPIATRFTRKYTYEGPAEITSTFHEDIPEGKRVFIDAERARYLSLSIDGIRVPKLCGTLSTPYSFEVTGLLKKGSEISFTSDNSYPGLPHNDIVYSSAATDETQTNWNGIIGYVRVRIEDPVFIENIRFYPHGQEADIVVTINAANTECSKKISLVSDCLTKTVSKEIQIQSGCQDVFFKNIPLSGSVQKWDEYEGNLYELTATLEGADSKTIRTGIRDFSYDEGGRLTINGRRFFLRGEANCAVFPETGHLPCDKDSWIEILSKYKSYGVNVMRFHSHCPPEAAFAAADELGIMMQPELSHWNPKDAFLTEGSVSYYTEELTSILMTYANHPSFVMLTLGNELNSNDEGFAHMRRLTDLFHQLDQTRLVANGSNTAYGEKGPDEASDFYTSMSCCGQIMRSTSPNMEGYLNNDYPSAMHNYSDSIKELRKIYTKPVFEFEVGQYEILPDFDEIEDFHGISTPDNLTLIQRDARKNNLLPVWKKYCEATGELSLLCYREEVEACMRTPEMSGLSLLGIQDFPGQGTALVGMMNSHLQPKPYSFARPERFASFFRSAQVLVLLPKYTYTTSETLHAQVRIANYGKEELRGHLSISISETTNNYISRLNINNDSIEIATTSDSILRTSKSTSTEIHNTTSVCPTGVLTDAGDITVNFEDIKKARALSLTVSYGSLSNTYTIWVYPDQVISRPEDVYETEVLDEHAMSVLENGGKVYLTPPSTKEAMPNSIKAQFSTDFWSVGTFPGQEGGMGQLIQHDHPLFENFPTSYHTDYQWWPMATQRAMFVPDKIHPIILEMDSYCYQRHMAQLFECRCQNGKIIVSTLGLQNLQQYPECRALLSSIYIYMKSKKFLPQDILSWEDLQDLFL